MQTHRLKFHPAFVPGKVSGVAVRWGPVAGERMMIRYRLDGRGDVVLPTEGPSGRGVDLWRGTCFELFLADGEGCYREFNFAPWGQWAAYAFSGYRTAKGDYQPLAEPEVLTDLGANVLTVTAFLPLAEFDGAQAAALTAVVAERRGRLSYWAERHGGLKPDFHNPACLVLPIPRSGKA